MLLLALRAAPSFAEGPIAIIVPPARAEARLERDELALIYQRKRQYWPDGARVQPVNLAADSPVRLAFSRAVLGADPAALESYWNEQYFRGVRPPYVVASNEAMQRFVAETPGAIGYVDACLVGSGVAVIGWLDGAGHWHHGRAVPAC
ncbi:substrate-binding domain-containing protein [Solimonas soli]|uniref:substrate-binding domain-containing protein n=1 Tax=Solimonas soli TaxID=413479 RepID=UPI0004811269|nr:substrate-binding domain-containing protein [Solimonas soli]